jgi:hypothetical protein
MLLKNIQRYNINIQRYNINIQWYNINIQRYNINIQRYNINIQWYNINIQWFVCYINIQRYNINIQRYNINIQWVFFGGGTLTYTRVWTFIYAHITQNMHTCIQTGGWSDKHTHIPTDRLSGTYI